MYTLIHPGFLRSVTSWRVSVKCGVGIFFSFFFFFFFYRKLFLGLGLCKWRSWETPLETFTAPVGRAPGALFLLTGILITFLCIRVNVCLIVVFIITILDLSINFYKVGTLDCTYFYPVLQRILYCNIHMFKALVFILITYYSLA